MAQTDQYTYCNIPEKLAKCPLEKVLTLLWLAVDAQRQIFSITVGTKGPYVLFPQMQMQLITISGKPRLKHHMAERWAMTRQVLWAIRLTFDIRGHIHREENDTAWQESSKERQHVGMSHCFILANCDWGSGSIPSFCFHINKGIKKRREMKAITHANEQKQGSMCMWERRVGGEGSYRGWGYYKKNEIMKRKGKMVLNEGTRGTVWTQSTTGQRERKLSKR